MKRHLVVYTSDVHGNEIQYEKLVAHSKKIHADSIIIGGDIAPKDSVQNFIDNQRRFLQYRLPDLLSKKEKTTNVFLIMGNDDCIVNQDVLEGNEFYQMVHNKRVALTEDFDIVGYSCVPITPFGIKDFEKFDISEAPKSMLKSYELRKKTNYNLEGWKSTKSGWEKFRFNPETEQADSIQKDLEMPLFHNNPGKTVYVIHTPPNDTNLDMILTGSHAGRGSHVGSFAVRSFIEQCQPYLTLHGHIHETVYVSGDFRQTIGNTLCLSSGNHNEGEKLALLVFDLYDPKAAQRIII